MPLAQFLQSIKGQCRYCHQQAGFFHQNHQDCQENHRSGWQEMVQFAAQAASAHTFNEAALRQTLQAIANRSRRNTAPQLSILHTRAPCHAGSRVKSA